jgi:hypothetical protein
MSNGHATAKDIENSSDFLLFPVDPARTSLTTITNVVARITDLAAAGRVHARQAGFSQSIGQTL